MRAPRPASGSLRQRSSLLARGASRGRKGMLWRRSAKMRSASAARAFAGCSSLSRNSLLQETNFEFYSQGNIHPV